jgi:hypothetical protein
MTRRRAPGQHPQMPQSPLDQAMLVDEQNLADQLAGIVDQLADFDAQSIVGKVYLKPNNGQGPWQWCEDYYPPFVLENMLADLKDRFGPGFYQLRIYAGGKIRKNADFSIAKEKVSNVPPPTTTLGGAGNFHDLMMLMMTQQQAAADRQMQMMASMSRQTTDTLAAILPAIVGGRPAGTSAADIAALVTALRPAGEGGGGLAETLKAMAAMKELLGPAGGGDDDGEGVRFDPNNLVESGARLIGPAMKAIGDLVQNRREAAAGVAPAGAPPTPGGGDQLALGPPPTSRFRLIELVRVDVSYFFGRGFDPAKAADLVYDIIEANNVTDAEIDQLAATFALSPTGLEDLAREGIDLRSNPGWAFEFFQELAAIHSGDQDDSAGGEGGAGDAAGNGPPGEGGTTRPADS